MCSWWFPKISENSENNQFLKINKKNLSQAKCQVFGVFQVDKAGLQSPVLEFDKNSTQNAYFLKKVDFCIFNTKIVSW